MSLFGFYTEKEVKSSINNAVNAVKKSKGLIDQITINEVDRTKADVSKWRDSLEMWEDVKNPDRFEMMQLYNEIINDNAVATHLNTIIHRIIGTEFEAGTLTDKGMTLSEPLMLQLKGRWFEKIIEQVILSEMMGFTLVELLPLMGEYYTQDNVSLIPRYMVIPEKGLIRKQAQNNGDAIDFKQDKYLKRLLQLGDTYDKGLFNNIALLYIYKKNAMAFWANYQAKFGIPPIIVKTDLTNQPSVDKLTEFLINMRANTFGIIGYEDAIEPISTNSVDAFKTFQELIKVCDDGIAQVLEGQTMTSSDGSSRSQAEVHQDTANDWHMGRLRMIENAINEQLLPIMALDGIAKENDVFRFKEVKDIDLTIDRAVKLKQAGFDVDVDYMTQLTGIPLQQSATAQPQQQPAAVIKAINDLYGE